MATKKTSARSAAAKQLVEVTLRRLAKDAGAAKQGQYILVINPKVFGSTGGNWLGGKSFTSKDEAIAAAPKLGGRVAA